MDGQAGGPPGGSVPGRSQVLVFALVLVAGLSVLGVLFWKAFAGGTPPKAVRPDSQRLEQISASRRAETAAEARRLRQQGLGDGYQFDAEGHFLGAVPAEGGLPRNKTLEEAAGPRLATASPPLELQALSEEVHGRGGDRGSHEESVDRWQGRSSGRRRPETEDVPAGSHEISRDAESESGPPKSRLGYSINSRATWAVRRPGGGSGEAGDPMRGVGGKDGSRAGTGESVDRLLDGAVKAQEQLLAINAGRGSGAVRGSEGGAAPVMSLLTGGGIAGGQPGPSAAGSALYAGAAEVSTQRAAIGDMRMGHEAPPPEVVREGKFLDCALVNQLRADLVESPVIAMVVNDFVSIDGEWVLVPAGTKLMGAAGRVQNVQQSRVYLRFERLIYPDQRSAYFPSRKVPAVDALGAAGIDGDVNRHLFLQFGSAVMLGVLDGLAAAVDGVASSAANPSVRDLVLGRTSSSLSTVVAGVIARYGNVVPTITVEPGEKLKVFFAEDVVLTPYLRVSELASVQHAGFPEPPAPVPQAHPGKAVW